MEIEDPAEERQRFELIGAAIAFVVVATVVAFFVVVILPAGSDGPPATAATSTPTPDASPQRDATPPPPEGPRLTRAIELRSGPDPRVAIVTRLAETDAIRIVGRSQDAAWLTVGLVDRPGMVGWVPADAVGGVEDVDALPVVASGSEATSTPGGTLTPDLPDLVIEHAFSRDNRLMVRILNQGAGDAGGEFLLSVNGADPIALDVKPGEPLRAGQALEAPVPDFTLQLRQGVTLRLVPSINRPEEDETNNDWQGFVEPDQPNDIEVVGASIQAPDDTLVVVVRNNSPIPLVGSLIITVRETLPSTTLLGRESLTTVMPPDELMEFEFEDITDVSLSQITINVHMNAILDADIQNNVFPR
ncbi:MAG: SH3 domain-containing protein [Dehalococcoidia bacterium]|nr:SH3 domain-containing protein [Dehalococcoidia bacterium]